MILDASSQTRGALVVGLVLLALFVLLAFVVPQAPLDLEQRWNEWMSDIATPVLKDVALVFNALGRGVGRALLIAVPAVVLFVARRRWSLAAFALTEALTPLISSITKALVGRPRARLRLSSTRAARRSRPGTRLSPARPRSWLSCSSRTWARGGECGGRSPCSQLGGNGLEPHLPARALAARRYGRVDSRRGRGSRRLRRRPDARGPPLGRGFWSSVAHTPVRPTLRLAAPQLPPRLLQESVLLNAEESEPPASFKVLIADVGLVREALHLRCERRDRRAEGGGRRIGLELCESRARGVDRVADVGRELIELLLGGLSLRGVRGRDSLDLRQERFGRGLGLRDARLEGGLRDSAD